MQLRGMAQKSTYYTEAHRSAHVCMFACADTGLIASIPPEADGHVGHIPYHIKIEATMM